MFHARDLTNRFLQIKPMNIFSQHLQSDLERPDIISAWRCHQMETFFALLALRECPVNSPHKGQWRGALMFSLICAWTNGWANNRDVGDLRRHRTHYDVTVMAIIVASRKYLLFLSVNIKTPPNASGSASNMSIYGVFRTVAAREIYVLFLLAPFDWFKSFIGMGIKHVVDTPIHFSIEWELEN